MHKHRCLGSLGADSQARARLTGKGKITVFSSCAGSLCGDRTWWHWGVAWRAVLGVRNEDGGGHLGSWPQASVSQVQGGRDLKQIPLVDKCPRGGRGWGPHGVPRWVWE